MFSQPSIIKQLLYDPENPLLFNNGFFVFFFSAFIALYFLFRNNFAVRRYIFCFFSLYFFYKASGSFVIIVVISAFFDFLLSNAIYRSVSSIMRKSLIILSVAVNLGLLVFFKYTNFFAELSNQILSTGFNPLNILLPVGISFFTFENISYSVDVYSRKLTPTQKFSEYLLFLSFFPKLVMGPIVRAQDFIPQINQPYHLTHEEFSKGFFLIIFGLFKKLIISDYLTINYVDFIFDNPARYSGIENMVAVYAYAMVIYCDFSGYSDVAIGIAKWLGFSIPTNFLSPYQSTNITEFWQRWHISLSSWLKDYLYIPLGGNKKGSFFTFLFSLLFFVFVFWIGIDLFKLNLVKSAILVGTVFLIFVLPAILERKLTVFPARLNLLVTMFLGGFWHGASINFLIWGALHGIFLTLHKILMLVTSGTQLVRGRSVPRSIGVLLTFHVVCFSWIFFKAADYSTAITMINKIVYNMDLSITKAFIFNYKWVLVMIVFSGLLHGLPDNFFEKNILRFGKLPVVVHICIFFLFLMVYALMKSSEQVMPIYLQF